MNNIGGVFHLGEQGWGMAHRDRGCISVGSLDRGTSRAEWTQYGLFSAVELGAASSWPVYIGVESWLEKRQPGDVMHMLYDWMGHCLFLGHGEALIQI